MSNVIASPRARPECRCVLARTRSTASLARPRIDSRISGVERMAARAAILRGIDGGERVAPQGVISSRCRYKVCWVHAATVRTGNPSGAGGRIVARMVEREPFRNCADEKPVSEPVGRDGPLRGKSELPVTADQVPEKRPAARILAPVDQSPESVDRIDGGVEYGARITVASQTLVVHRAETLGLRETVASPSLTCHRGILP